MSGAIRTITVETSGIRTIFSLLSRRINCAVERANEILFYQAPLKDGKLACEPEIALKVPFVFLFMMEGNAYDFTRDLFTIVFTQPTMQADIYLLSH